MLATGVLTVVLVWPSADPSGVQRAMELGADALLLRGALPKAPDRPAGLMVLAEVAAQGAEVQAAKAAGFDGVAVTAKGSAAEFRQFLNAQGGFVRYVVLDRNQLDWDVRPAEAVFKDGQWPGLQMSAGEAGATERPWITANLHLYAYLRSMHRERAAFLNVPADEKSTRFDGVEVALAEAFAAGGGVLIEPPEMYRTGVAKGDGRAVAGWKRAAEIVKFAKAQQGVPRDAGGSQMALVGGPLDEGLEEILNLTFRNNLSPQLLPPGKLALAGRGLRIVALANRNPSTAETTELMRFVRGGGIVVWAPPAQGKAAAWWGAAKKARTEAGRDLYAVGRGTLHVYREPVKDESEFAWDLKEISGTDTPTGRGLFGLDLRVWYSNSVLGVLHGSGTERVAVLISYGRVVDQEFLIGMRGRFAGASSVQPGQAPQNLDLMKYEQRVEWNQTGLNRVAVITLKGLGQ
ncbi:MAG: hypothetical protein HY821_06805 [Acidobacteria bacterium]|nr:hypothetical protein [Acidobacteriota bacterium]